MRSLKIPRDASFLEATAGSGVLGSWVAAFAALLFNAVLVGLCRAIWLLNAALVGLRGVKWILEAELIGLRGGT